MGRLGGGAACRRPAIDGDTAHGPRVASFLHDPKRFEAVLFFIIDLTTWALSTTRASKNYFDEISTWSEDSRIVNFPSVSRPRRSDAGSVEEKTPLMRVPAMVLSVMMSCRVL